MKKGEKAELDFDLVWGMKGLKVSMAIALLILIILGLVYLSTFKGVSLDMMAMPKGFNDWSALLAGVIIFIALPFLFGIVVGSTLKNGKKNKK